MILSDNEIGLLCEGEQPMISPFLASQISANNHGARLLSYGVSSYGYDVQLAEQFQIFSNQDATLIDPKRLDPQSLKDAKIHLDPVTQEKYAILPPHSYGLSYTKQYLRIPNDVLVICLGKSTYARCGIHTNVTPLEPGQCGRVRDHETEYSEETWDKLTRYNARLTGAEPVGGASELKR